MKSVWTDFPLAGAWPAWAKYRRHGITRVYVDAREPNLLQLVDGIHSQGFEAGIFRDPHWGGWSSAVEYAQLASGDIKLAEQGVPKQIAYMHDLEVHDPGWILEVLRAWRKPRPLRTTDVTWEPNQGGLWAQPAQRDELLRLLVSGGPGGVYHQNYFGKPADMTPAVAERVRGNLMSYGFPDNRLFGFYDGVRLPEAWDGCVFTGDRLPA